jgi:hypothetical protein
VCSTDESTPDTGLVMPLLPDGTLRIMTLLSPEDVMDLISQAWGVVKQELQTLKDTVKSQAGQIGTLQLQLANAQASATQPTVLTAADQAAADDIANEARAFQLASGVDTNKATVTTAPASNTAGGGMVM